MTKQEALVVLNAIPGISGEVIERLVPAIGSPDHIFDKKEEELLELGLSQNLVRNIVHFPKDKFLEGEYNYLRKINAQLITIDDEGYPPSLKIIKHAPIVLYLKG